MGKLKIIKDKRFLQIKCKFYESKFNFRWILIDQIYLYFNLDLMSRIIKKSFFAIIIWCSL